MKNLHKVKDLVVSILEKDELTRNSDSYLYLRVIRKISEMENANIDRMPVSYFLMHMPELPYPPFESVRRARQKAQAECPWLAASERVTEGRSVNEREYRRFATEKKERKPTIKEHECPICHKIFVPAPQHVYKTHDKARFVCSYHCSLASERAFEERMAANRERRKERRRKAANV